MKNKDIDNMLNTLRKHSPNWIDRIRVYINKLENDLLAYRRPVGYSVVDVKLKAKKEVFDKFRKILDVHRGVSMVTCSEDCFCWNIDTELMKEEQRHLSVLMTSNV